MNFSFYQASLIAQLVRNLSAMQETQVWFLGREDHLEIGYSLQYSWASLVVQLVKNPPAMQKTWVWSPSGKIPWRRERLPTPVSWPRIPRIPRTVESMGSQRVRLDWVTFIWLFILSVAQFKDSLFNIFLSLSFFSRLLKLTWSSFKVGEMPWGILGFFFSFFIFT